MLDQLLYLLRQQPTHFQTIGLGGKCVGLVHPQHPDRVLLLQGERVPHHYRNAVTTTEEAGQKKKTRSHRAAVAFAKQHDDAIQAHMAKGQVHSKLIEHSEIDEPLVIKLSPEFCWRACAVRLLQRVPGQALDYREFAQGTINTRRTRLLARQIADFLFNLHHRTAAATTKYATATVWAAKQETTINFRNSDRYKAYVTTNVDCLKGLLGREQTNDATGLFRKNLTAMGVDLATVVELSEVLKEVIDNELAKDRRYGLIHGDVHPGNIIADDARLKVNGLCDWMNSGYDFQIYDFAGLGIARKLLPEVLSYYQDKEKATKVDKKINGNLALAMGCMRQIYLWSGAIRHARTDLTLATISFAQIIEISQEIGKTNTQVKNITNKLKRMEIQKPILLSGAKGYDSHPDVC